MLSRQLSLKLIEIQEVQQNNVKMSGIATKELL